ncbi:MULTISPECIES: ABC transporter ATP-binding protein [unclassified Thalassospira]|uniref:ABC transporter ATP-binding protein n=1 Tax=unclassified Thalassospira TaxID=2648997 RepID=UPI001B120ADA|nr:ABC transporter ATP-binding protein [Thalassospira sp.]MBO6770293.1 ABC transporter ATP-binding protein [Thalassospira sp.]
MTEQGSKAVEKILEVRDLVTQVATPSGPKTVVDGLSFDLCRGETLCIAGESGSGKSMTSLSIMGLLPEPMARVASGEIRLNGTDLLTLSERAMRDIRGNKIAMIFQEPMTSLNPVLTIGRQLGEAISTHNPMSGSRVRARALEVLKQVRISEPEKRLSQYPHELSGGMRQRVMIAMALACNPDVLIADEPTTALDVTIQAQILGLMRDLQRETGTAIILITHDMGVVAEMANRVIVMNQGKVVESGTVTDVFEKPDDPYTRGLLAAVPRLGAMAGTEGPASSDGKALERGLAKPLVSVRDLTVRFDIRGGLLQRVQKRVHAVEQVSFDIFAGETLSIVGESGCGKSTTGRALMNLIPWQGEVVIDGREIDANSRIQTREVRRNIQMIFQDPYASLDPRMTVGELVAEPLVIHGLASGSELDDRVEYLFRRVGLPADAAKRHPHEFSGGQRQRICIARALSLSPKVIIADESVSALDVSVQAQVLDLLGELQAESGLSYLFISHDMAVVEQISHRVAVMYMGQIVEIGPRQAVFEDSQHPYTKKLMAAVPIPDPRKRRQDFSLITGEVPSPVHGLDYQPELADLQQIAAHHFVAKSAMETAA